MTTINWNVSSYEHGLIVDIALRASALAGRLGVDYPQRDAIMDVTAVHANGNGLRLSELAAADEGNFAHDVFGIRRHINRETGKLENCFLPRYSKPAVFTRVDARRAAVNAGNKAAQSLQQDLREEVSA